MYQKLKRGIIPMSSTQLRVYNEGATIFLIAIVFLVVMKNLLSMIWALVGLFIVMAVLMFAIKLYRNKRLSNRPNHSN